MAEATSGLVALVIVSVGIVLVIAALIAPLYIMAIYGHVRRIREMMEEMKT